jgi:hypothetical protein
MLLCFVRSRCLHTMIPAAGRGHVYIGPAVCLLCPAAPGTVVCVGQTTTIDASQIFSALALFRPLVAFGRKQWGSR